MWQTLFNRTLLSSLTGLLVWLNATAVVALPALEDVVLYEVNLRAFSEAGDLAGVTARLDEIQSVGANVLWLMPIHPVGQERSAGGLGSPYSVQDYGSVSSEYGGLSELNTLVDAAHDRGMSVILDWVANHTAWDHPWISNADWYTQNSQGQIVHPPGTGWLDVADLNYSNSAMRSAMISEMQYWVTEVGIDGFRADAADFVPYDFWHQAIPAVRGATERPLLMLAEGDRPDHHVAGFDVTFDWSFSNLVKNVFNSSGSALTLPAGHQQIFSGFPAGKSVLRFTTNHDESAWDATPVEVFGSLEASLAAYVVTVAYGGTPLIYGSQEIGWEENIPFFTKAPIDWTTGAETAEWYEKLFAIREDHEALRKGTLTDKSNINVAMLMRQHEDDQVLILVNTRNSAHPIQIPAEWQGSWYNQFTGDSQTLTPLFSLDSYDVLILAQTSPLEPGDIDDDGDVDGRDFLAWQRGESPIPYSVIDLADWHSSYNETQSADVTAVPEPNSILVGYVLFGLLTCHRQRCESSD
jgi:glycosidase